MNIATTTGRMWTAAATFARIVQADLAETVTGMRWRRPPADCPPWCGQAHYCTARHGHPSGEHRSAPAAWSTGYGSLVATRVGTVAGRNRIEVRALVALPVDDEKAGQLAQAVLTAVHLTLTNLTTDPAPVTTAATVRYALSGGAR